MLLRTSAAICILLLYLPILQAAQQPEAEPVADSASAEATEGEQEKVKDDRWYRNIFPVPVISIPFITTPFVTWEWPPMPTSSRICTLPTFDLSLTRNDDAIGCDYDFTTLKMKTLSFHQLGKRWVLGVRGQYSQVWDWAVVRDSGL